MDGVTISLIVAVLGVIISITSFFASQRKTNTDDGRKMGEFMGEIHADIKNIKEDIAEIKQDRNSIDKKISKVMEEHEKKYHSRDGK